MPRLREGAAAPGYREGVEETLRALLSVANRDGIADLARDLSSLGVEIYATDGTVEALRAEGVEVQDRLSDSRCRLEPLFIKQHKGSPLNGTPGGSSP